MFPLLKKSPLITLILAIIFLTPGCWNRRELDQLAIVLGTGVDLMKDRQINLSVQIVKPGEMKGGAEGGGNVQGKPALVLSNQGKTISKAVSNFISIGSRKLFFSHNLVVIFGESLAENGIGSVLDFFERDPELRAETPLLIAQGEARNLLAIPGGLEKVSAQDFKDALNVSDLLSKSMKVSLNDFLLAYNSKTTAPVAPRIKLEENEGKQSFKIDGMAVFRKGKLVGWLNNRETRGLLWVLGKAKGGILVLDSDFGGQDGSVSTKIIKVKRTVKAEFVDEKPSITVKIEADTNVEEETTPIDLTTPEKINDVEQMQADLIKSEVQAAFDKAKELDADIFGFGEELHRADPKEWENLKARWEDEFPQLELQILVKTKVRHAGGITKPSEPM